MSVVNKSYYNYSNGSYELKQYDEIPEAAASAKTEIISRSMLGPIPREDVAQLVEHIDLKSPTWEKEMKAVLGQHQFVVVGINSHIEAKQEIGMSKMTYAQTYLNWKTAVSVFTSAALFISPGIVQNYFPNAAEYLGLPEWNNDQNIISYSTDAWGKKIQDAGARLTKFQESMPQLVSAVSAAAFSYVGYQGLESLVTKAIQYPATDYKTWSALNMKDFLAIVHPKMIPNEYKEDPVLKGIVSPTGDIIRSPFMITNAQEFGNIYEEHVLKNILNHQQTFTGKLVCPSDSNTPIQSSDVKRNEELSDRIELRLLLLDAHTLKNARQQPNFSQIPMPPSFFFEQPGFM